MLDRKAAKEQYLQSLAQLKSNPSNESGTVQPSFGVTPSADNSIASSSAGTRTAVDRREQILAEKRKAFFEKQLQSTAETSGQRQPNIPPPTSLKTTNDIFAPAPSFAKNESKGNGQIAVGSLPSHVEEPNLSNWNKLGFPSEFAYAKSLGLLDAKPQNVAPSLGTQQPIKQSAGAILQTGPYPPQQIMGNSNFYEAGGNLGNLSSLSTLGVEGTVNPSANISKVSLPQYSQSNVSNDDRRRSQQQEYAKALQQQIESQGNASRQQAADSFTSMNTQPALLDSIGINTRNQQKLKQADYAKELDKQMIQGRQQKQQDLRGNESSDAHQSGFQIGSAIDTEAKKRQQQAYSDALKQQMPQTENRGSMHHQAQGPRGELHHMDAASGIKYDDVINNDAQQQQQLRKQQYARQLEEQMASNHQRLDVNDTNDRRGQAQPSSFNIGGDGIDIAAKKRAQQEYGIALMQQMQNQRLDNAHVSHTQAPQGSSSGFGNGFGEHENNKRERQLQYAQELEQQMAFNQRNKVSNERDNSFQIGAAKDIGSKRQAQQEYSEALRRDQYDKERKQMNNNRDSEASNGFGHGFGEYGNDKKAKQAQYAKELNQQMANNRRGLYGIDDQPSFQIGNDADKDAKRRMQQEYARALEQQMHQPVVDNRREPTHNARGIPVAGLNPDGSIQMGWELGPLGVPVRKTLDVGRRAVQKDFNARVSPTKPTGGAGIGSNNDIWSPNKYNDFSPPRNYPQMQQQWNPSGGGGSGGGGGGGGGISSQPQPHVDDMFANALGDHEEKQKRLRADQARALELQIQLNKQRVEEEKRKQKEDEEKEQLRLEKERVEIQAAFEREQKQTKQKQEDDNKRELEKQIELNREAKQRDLIKQKYMEEQEELRLARERELLRQREEEETRREREASAAQAMQSKPPSNIEKTVVAGSGAASRKDLFAPASPPRSAVAKSLSTGNAAPTRNASKASMLSDAINTPSNLSLSTAPVHSSRGDLFAPSMPVDSPPPRSASSRSRFGRRESAATVLSHLDPATEVPSSPPKSASTATVVKKRIVPALPLNQEPLNIIPGSPKPSIDKFQQFRPMTSPARPPLMMVPSQAQGQMIMMQKPPRGNSFTHNPPLETDSLHVKTSSDPHSSANSPMDKNTYSRDRLFTPPIILNPNKSLSSSRLISDSKFIFPDGSEQVDFTKSNNFPSSNQSFTSSLHRIAGQGWQPDDTNSSYNDQGGNSNQFDVDKVYEKSRRKWQLLQRLNDIQPNDAELQMVFQDGRPRPLTSGSVLGRDSVSSSRLSSRGGDDFSSNFPQSARPMESTSALRRSGALVLAKSNNLVSKEPPVINKATLGHSTSIAWRRIDNPSSQGVNEAEDYNDDLYSEFGL